MSDSQLLNPERQTPGPKPGRPRALDEIKRREILAIVAAGCGLETAARYAGVSTRTVQRELRRNKDFWDKYRRAELKSKIRPLNAMTRAVKKSWRAAAWMLERKSPRDFAKVHPRMIDPLELDESLGQLFDAVFRSIRDPVLRRKVSRNIEKALQTQIHELPSDRRSPRPPKRKKKSPLWPDPFVDNDDELLNDIDSGDDPLAATDDDPLAGSDDDLPDRADDDSPGAADDDQPRTAGSISAVPSRPLTGFLHIVSSVPATAAPSASSHSVNISDVPIPQYDLPPPNTFELDTRSPEISEDSPTPHARFRTPHSDTFCPASCDNIPSAATTTPTATSVAPAVAHAPSRDKTAVENPS